MVLKQQQQQQQQAGLVMAVEPLCSIRLMTMMLLQIDMTRSTEPGAYINPGRKETCSSYRVSGNRRVVQTSEEYY